MCSYLFPLTNFAKPRSILVTLYRLCFTFTHLFDFFFFCSTDLFYSKAISCFYNKLEFVNILQHPADGLPMSNTEIYRMSIAQCLHYVLTAMQYTKKKKNHFQPKLMCKIRSFSYLQIQEDQSMWSVNIKQSFYFYLFHFLANLFPSCVFWGKQL